MEAENQQIKSLLHCYVKDEDDTSYNGGPLQWWIWNEGVIECLEEEVKSVWWLK